MVRDYGTEFQETEALLAVGNGDERTAEQILADMLPGELRKLDHDARRLADMVRDALAEQGVHRG